MIPYGNNPFPLLVRARDTVAMEDSFDLLFGDEMFDLLVLETSLLINRKLGILRAHKKHLFESLKYSYLREALRSEIACTYWFHVSPWPA